MEKEKLKNILVQALVLNKKLTENPVNQLKGKLKHNQKHKPKHKLKHNQKHNPLTKTSLLQLMNDIEQP